MKSISSKPKNTLEATNDSIADSPFYQEYKGRLSPKIVNMKTAISLNYHYVYSRIPKAANSTVVANLYKAETGKILIDDTTSVKDEYFSTLSALNADELNQLNSFFKFTVVRNPLARIQSAYLDKISRDQTSTKTNMVRDRLGIAPEKSVNFDDFIDYLEQGGISQNGHWSLQKDLLCFQIEEYEIVGKVENLASDLTKILKRIYGAHGELISANTHKTNSKNLVLNVSQKKKIYKLYEQDFELFEYSLL